ncbi:MAG: hypothetical protein ABEH88_07870 [Halobacteriales archaeon]
MIDRTALGSILFALLIVVGMAVPAVALSASTGEPSTSDPTETSAAVTAQNDSTASARNGSSVNVTIGPQLSTIVSVSSDEVQTGFENTVFDISFENASEEGKAEAIADRADELRDRAESIREDYDEATEAVEDGELTKSEYARQLAVLNARATNLLNSYEQLSQRAVNVSAVELGAAGVNQTALNQSVENLSSVTGVGARALLEQFTGESEGEVRLDTENGLSIKVESEDGERSREFERPRDSSDTLAVSQAAALETARGTLSSGKGNWTLTSSEVDEDDGAYEFAFVLRNAPNLTGEAKVSIDGSSGDIFSFEEEIEPRDGEDDDSETADDDRELAIVVVEGTPGPKETVTVQVLANDEPAENVAVSLNDRAVGTTDADGRVTVTFPAAGDVELTAQTDDAEDELDFEFETPDEAENESES